MLAATAGGAGPVFREPNDPGWPGEWGLRQTGLSSLLPYVGPTAHPVVAIVDSGVNPTFPDLRGALVRGHDFLTGGDVPRDSFGHGTGVSIALAARADNGYGIVGACPVCRIMPLRVSARGETSPDLIGQAIRWAVDHGSRIVSISLGGGGTGAPPAEQSAVDYAVAHGAVVVASAGNGGDRTPIYPGAVPGVVSVTGTDQRGSLYAWAARGSWVDLASPGCLYYTLICGSSYAAPTVAGAVALLTTLGAGITAPQAAAALAATARPLDGIADGRIDVAAAARSLTTLRVVPLPEQVLVLSGSFTRRLTTAFVLRGARFVLRVHFRRRRGCRMTFASADSLYDGAPVGTGDLVASSDDATPGRYTLSVNCTPGAANAYTLSLYRSTAPSFTVAG